MTKLYGIIVLVLTSCQQLAKTDETPPIKSDVVDRKQARKRTTAEPMHNSFVKELKMLSENVQTDHSIWAEKEQGIN